MKRPIQLERCPYYVTKSREEKVQITITCQNPVENLGFEVMSQRRFLSKAERKNFMELFCWDRYQSCPFFQAIQAVEGSEVNRTE